MNDPTAYLLAELAAVKDENRALRVRVRSLERSRDLWRTRARAWRWGALHGRRDVPTVSTGLRTATQ